MVKEKLQAQLVAPINPRKAKGQTNPARGIKEITPYGQPICISGFPLFLLGQDHKTREYIWACHENLIPTVPNMNLTFPAISKNIVVKEARVDSTELKRMSGPRLIGISLSLAERPGIF